MQLCIDYFINFDSEPYRVEFVSQTVLEVVIYHIFQVILIEVVHYFFFLTLLIQNYINIFHCLTANEQSNLENF